MSEQYSHLPPEYGPHPQFPKSVKPGIPKLPLPKVKWQTVKIGDLFKVINDPVRMEDDQQYDLVTVKRARGGVVDRETLYGRDISVKSQFYVHEGNFLISKRQIVHGACGFVPKKLEGAIVSNEYSVLACTNLILPAFLNYLSYTPYFQQTCFHSSIGVHVEKMIFKLDEWFRWKINIPSLPEQQKIADFLSSVDTKLAKLGRKKELLGDYKRGLMQQIFSQKLRFKQDDGSEFPEWEYSTLGEVASIYKGSGLSKDALVDSGFYKCIHYGELFTKYNEYTECVLSRTNSNEGFKCEYGDIAMPTSDVTPKGLATATAILEDGVKAGGDINIIRLSAQFDPKFISYYINAHPNKIIPLVSGTTVKHIYAKDLKGVALSHPSNREQQKIANFLSSIDQKIDVIAKQIEQLETFKKGLLQKLFV